MPCGAKDKGGSMSYRRSLGAFFSAAALIASLSPAVAFAKTTGKGITDVDDATINVTGLEKGDTVTAYQVFDAYIDSNNVLKYTPATGLPADYDTIDELGALTTADAQKAAGDAYSKAFVNDGAHGVAGPVTGNVGEDGKASLTLDSGYWVVVVTSTSGKTKVFQPTTIDASPVAGTDGTYKAKTLSDQEIKNEPVTVKKGVGERYEEKTDAYTVGQMVPFKVTTNVPNYPADSKDATFTVSDTPSAGLEIDTGSITVKVGGTVVWENGAAVDASAFKAATTTQATTGYTFDFARDFVLAHPGASVEITYNAKLTSAAFSHDENDVTGNTARVTFNPNPYDSSTVTPDDKTKVQTYGYVFPKTDKDQNALEGAAFTLYDEAGNEIKDENGNAITSTSKIVDGKAYVYFEDLGSGSYVAKETTVPAGKQKAQDVKFTVDKDTAKADNPATTDITENNYLVSTSNVVDPDQPMLPVTGEAGTVAITVGGLALVGAACVVASRGLKRSK
jgi:fimbrial isopeptide formation D2 family protein/LPXTG-motif cell wall-anchored protein